MNVTIRKVAPGDENALARIQTESWKSAFAHILDAETLEKCTDPVRATEMYRRLLENHVGNGYLLSLDGEPHLFAWWNDSRDEETSGAAELIAIHSLPENRRRGYGSVMMDRVLSDVRNAGYREIVLWVFGANAVARSFYEAFGFAPTGLTRTELGAETVCYSKKL